MAGRNNRNLINGFRGGSYNLWSGKRSYSRTYYHFLNKLMMLALMRYKWSNLPETVSERWIEATLLTSGSMAFFEDDIGDLRCLAMAYTKMNMYNDPDDMMVYSYNYQAFRNYTNAVPMFSNWLRVSDMEMIQYYCELLADIRQTMVVNIKAQKTPVLILCEQKERMTLENLYQKYEGGAPVIYGNKNLQELMMSNGNHKLFEVLKTDAPFIAPELRTIEQDYMMECLTYLGIDTTNRGKKERLISFEVSSDKGEMEKCRQIGLTPRQESAEKTNKMFGYNIGVEYNTMVELFADAVLDSAGRVGEEDVNVHDED